MIKFFFKNDNYFNVILQSVSKTIPTSPEHKI